MNKNKEKSKQLQMPIATARGRLHKSIMFSLIQKLNLDICYRCQRKIETIDVFSIDHKEPWLYSSNAKELYFDLNNITFSHLTCNSVASRPRKRQKTIHGTNLAYNHHKCRCDLCRKAHTEVVMTYREKH